MFFMVFHQSVLSQIVLTEVMFDPVGSEYTDEFVEIINLSEFDSVDMAGWQFTDGTGDDEIIDAGMGMVILPGQYGIILDRDYFDHSITYDHLIPMGALILTIDGPTLGENGLSNSRAEAVSLLDVTGNVVNQYIYSPDNMAGHSDEKIDLQGNNGFQNWADSRELYGSPGFLNSVAILRIDLKALHLWNEPMRSRKGDDIRLWVSVLNWGEQSVVGFGVDFFEDLNGDSAYDSIERIGSVDCWDVVLLANDTLCVSKKWVSPESGIKRIGVHIDCPDDQRQKDNIFITNISIGFTEKRLVINEIMFAPFGGQPEWVELFNPGNEEIDLRGWNISDTDTTRKVVIAKERAIIPPAGYGVIVELNEVEESLFSGCPLFKVPQFPSLNNDGDAVVLFDPVGFMIDRVDYQADWGGDRGISLERIQPTLGSNDRSNWSSCVSGEGMTPGRQNSLYATFLPTHVHLAVSPNPFSPDDDGMADITLISYHLPSKVARVSIRIFDVRGRHIRSLMGASSTGAQGSIIWDGRDERGRLARVGIYIVCLEGLNDYAGEVFSAKSTVVLAGRL